MYYEQELYHHGIKGQKWGVRRFQNADGSLTNAGKKRYGESFVEDPYGRTKAPKLVSDDIKKAASQLAAKGIKVGIEKAKQARVAKKEERAFRNDIINKAVDHDNDFDKTKEGSKLLKAYQKEYSKMMDTPNWGSEKEQKAFDKAERDYLTKQGAYTAKKIYESHGEKGLNSLAGYKLNGTVDDMINRISNDYVRIHGA